MERYLINYLREHTDDEIVRKYIYYFKYELDRFIYDESEHISHTHKYRHNASSIKYRLFKQFQYFTATIRRIKTYEDKINVLSNVYFLKRDQLWNLGFNPISSIFLPQGKHQIIGDRKSVELVKRIHKAIVWGEFNDLFNKEFFYALEEHKKSVVKKIKEYNLRALLLPANASFGAMYLIEIFKQLNRPSITFLHGLPGIYPIPNDDCADFLMVYGEKIKCNYVKFGFNKDKIIVTGNPRYEKIPIHGHLRNSLDNILVLPVATSFYYQIGWGNPVLVDKGATMLYLYQVQSVLQQLGITHAKVRLHPSMNKAWITQFLDNDFYQMDNEPLFESLNKASLVIGSTSTVFLEALMAGVNYIVFEPVDNNGISLCNYPLVPPFDGSDGVEVANNAGALKYLLSSKYQVNSNILEEYMQPLNLEVLKNIIR
jgi:hypothetical protein